MDKSVPAGAVILLDFIAELESRGRYDIIYGNHQAERSITVMSLAELMAAQRTWGKRWGSSAAGRYQMMPTTLRGLQRKLGLTGHERFAPDLQDRLAFELLRQRGYDAFMARQMTTVDFARHLAMEWASLPVLAPCQGAHRRIAAGETYYAGDRLNRALATPEKFEAVLTLANAAAA